MTRYSFDAKVWQYPSEKAAWFFVYVGDDCAQSIKKKQEGKKKIGWGAIAVEVAIGETTWETSIFPDKRSGGYLLPIKALVRKSEGIFDGDSVNVRLKMIE